jgi:DNA-binding ferritin-like protein (Dps family)
MTMGIADYASKMIGDKRRWRAYKARVEQLPTPHRTAAEGIERYLLHTGPSDGDSLMTMLDDLADLFEQSAAAGTTVREIVGDDPIEFVEAFKLNYGQGSWMSREQQHLQEAVERAEREQESPS